MPLLPTIVASIILSFSDPLGDYPKDSTNMTKYINVDLCKFKAANDTEFLYLYIELNDSSDIARLADTTLYAGAASISAYIDVDFDSFTGLTWGWWRNGYDYRITPVHTPTLEFPWQLGDEFGIYRYIQEKHPVYAFELIDSIYPKASFDKNQIEFAIPLKYLSDSRDSIGLLFIAQERLDPWGGDYAPNEDVLGSTTIVYKIHPNKITTIKIDGKFEDWKDVPELELSEEQSE